MRCGYQETILWRLVRAGVRVINITGDFESGGAVANLHVHTHYH